MRGYPSTEVATQYIRDELQFPGVRQLLRIERERAEPSAGRRSCQQVHVISSRERTRADRPQMARVGRGHWPIEHKLHSVRDGRNTYDQDHGTGWGSGA